jgi:hypothetical protein
VLSTLYFTVLQDRIGSLDRRVAESEMPEEEKKEDRTGDREITSEEAAPPVVSRPGIETSDLEAERSRTDRQIPPAEDEHSGSEDQILTEPEVIHPPAVAVETEERRTAGEEISVADEVEFAMEDVAMAGEEIQPAEESGIAAAATADQDTFQTETLPPTGRESMARMAAMDEETTQAVALAEAPAARAKRETQTIPDTIPALPSGGMELFNRYLDDNRQYPASDTSGQIRTVRISFVVNSQGRPVNFEIIDSPGDEFSNEAIRLLREGPPWTQAFVGGTPELIRSRISIKFVPPSE